MRQAILIGVSAPSRHDGRTRRRTTMDAYDVWTDRFTASLRALGIAVMVVVLGWLVVSLSANFVELIGRGIAVASLIGYAAGRLHGTWQAYRARARKTIR